MADEATIKAPAAITACFIFLVIGAVVGFLFAGSGDGKTGTNGGTGTREGLQPGEFVFENPLRPVEVGEWALYNRGKGNQLQFEVQRVEPDGSIRMLQQDWDAEENRPLGSSSIPIHPNHFLWSHDQSGFVVMKVSIERIKAAGRTFDCLVVDKYSKLQGALRSWYSADIPVVGLVRQQTVAGPHAGFVNAEITDWSGR